MFALCWIRLTDWLWPVYVYFVGDDKKVRSYRFGKAKSSKQKQQRTRKSDKPSLMEEGYNLRVTVAIVRKRK